MTSIDSPPLPAAGNRKRAERSPIKLALLLAIALVGIYHNQEKVGEDRNDYGLATDRVEEQDVTDTQVQVGSRQKKIAFALLLSIGIYLALILQPDEVWRSNRLLWLIVGGLGWVAASFLWSSEPSLTVRELFRLSTVVMIAYGIAKNYSVQQAMFIVLVITSVSVLTAFAAELAAGCLVPWVADYRFQGGMHANMVGLHATIMVIAAFACMNEAKQKQVFVFLIALGVLALILTKSRTGAAACIVGFALLFSLRLDPRRVVIFWSSLVTFAAVVVLALAIGGSEWQRSFGGAAAMGRNEEIGSLTGRLPLWSYLSGYVRERPLMGYGYEGFWTGERRLAVGEVLIWYPSDAHSIYVNTTLEVGLIGSGLALATLLVAFVLLRKAYRETAVDGYAFFAALIAVALFHGIAESACSSARVAGLCIGTGVFIAAGWHANRLPVTLAAPLRASPPRTAL